ncbi:MAG: enolase C-terminal domain-like protein [Candidatus Dormibacteraceae bacterium]
MGEREDESERSGLLIRDVRTICTAPAGARLVVVKVETSEPGLYGLGCATFTQRAGAVVRAVDDYLRPLVVGRDPAAIEDLWQSGHLSGYWRGGPVLNNALSGLDEALWDLKGKVAGMPLHDLLGGRVRQGAPVYVHASGASFEEVEDRVRALQAEGYRYIRCQVAIPDSNNYGAGSVREAPFDEAGYLRTTPRLFDHLRSRLGDEVELLHDVHERVTPQAAIRLARELEPYRLFFFEDPFAPEDLGWFRQLRQQSAIPVAMGELFTSPAEYVPLIQDRLIDYVRMHISDVGGLTPARKIAALCEFFGVRTAWHGPGDVSPVGHAANVHLDLATSNFGVQEWTVPPDLLREVFPGMPEVREGMAHPSGAPGLGVDLDEARAARYPFPDDALHGAWPPVRRWDGSIVRP